MYLFFFVDNTKLKFAYFQNSPSQVYQREDSTGRIIEPLEIACKISVYGEFFWQVFLSVFVSFLKGCVT